MADRGSIAPGIRLDIQQLQLEAQHRWLRPAEICEILRNYQKFQISSEPPTRPSSGSLFLFDRKILRYFRKDGHNWRKKKDGKTVKEAHEKLKVGSVDVLHCYYAHGEDNECFQRRSYWLLEEEYMHIVFVHYLEVKGNRSSIREAEPLISSSQISNSVSSSVSNSYNEAFTGNTGSPSAVSSLTSSYEDIESEDNYQAMSKYPSPVTFQNMEDTVENNKPGSLMNSNFISTYPDNYKGSQLPGPGLDYTSLAQRGAGTNDYNQLKTLDLGSWEEVFQQSTRGPENLLPNPLLSGAPLVGSIDGYNESFSQLLDAGFGVNGAPGASLAPYLQSNNPLELSFTEYQDNTNITATAKQPLLGSIRAEEGLQKVDSFNKWMTKELAEVDDLDLKSTSNLSWQNIEAAASVDDPSDYSMSPSIGQDQLFDIQDFSPSCASTDSETKVVITGKFMVSPSEVFKYNWSCMFGEVEVPAKVLGNGVLCCYAPLHSVGRVPFYVTCSNRFACSQVREFEYLVQGKKDKNTVSSMTENQLWLRLQNLLSISSPGNFDSTSESIRKKERIFRKIFLLMEDELVLGVEQHLKEKVVSWLFDKVSSEDGKGPNTLDEEGQGLLHLAAALGFDWIIPPTLAAGVSVNFRDINGWTALHWAACYGREKTVAFLVALEAGSGLVTDPSPEFPLGRTAADLASANGYKGISGFLAEHSLTAHLETLTMTERKKDSPVENSMNNAVQTMREKVATPGDEGDGSDLSLKDSLAAVRNATQAAGRIHQVFRMQSFQRKQVSKGAGDDESLLTDEQFLSLVSSKIKRPGHPDEKAHSAATHIQKKFRGWKKRKEFLTIRERVVRIQAHVRGHQARKRYKPVVWSVGILEKAILRWRRKGTGLRGFRSDALNKAASSTDAPPVVQKPPSEEDDYDYLKEGRKQTEERLQKALVRVKSMVQYPDARAQYRRLLTAVEGFQKNQSQVQDSTLNRTDIAPAEGEDDMIDVESLLHDDNFMAIAFE
ncbi:calmodulin-binding transcription activator 2-like isoform X1 [Chenopodium quinoa]|uniref:calmodulin-binding transcription activator 2-like isoform X1 n=1 Tax=Chenopodium quinoa TaxID=63459 RepID=UPI000B78261A|nr:calmodulin-binding transcription activator 2-like isoform X1 [Chenopodium quinoa]